MSITSENHRINTRNRVYKLIKKYMYKESMRERIVISGSVHGKMHRDKTFKPQEVTNFRINKQILVHLHRS